MYIMSVNLVKQQIKQITKVQNSMKKKSDVLKNIKDELEIIQDRLKNLKDERGEGKVPRNGYTDIKKVKELTDGLNISNLNISNILDVEDMKTKLKELRGSLSLSGGTRRRKTRRSRRHKFVSIY